MMPEPSVGEKPPDEVADDEGNQDKDNEAWHRLPLS
jgi:hypothetical protein